MNNKEYEYRELADQVYKDISDAITESGQKAVNDGIKKIASKKMDSKALKNLKFNSKDLGKYIEDALQDAMDNKPLKIKPQIAIDPKSIKLNEQDLLYEIQELYEKASNEAGSAMGRKYNRQFAYNVTLAQLKGFKVDADMSGYLKDILDPYYNQFANEIQDVLNKTVESFVRQNIFDSIHEYTHNEIPKIITATKQPVPKVNKNNLKEQGAEAAREVKKGYDEEMSKESKPKRTDEEREAEKQRILREIYGKKEEQPVKEVVQEQQKQLEQVQEINTELEKQKQISNEIGNNIKDNIIQGMKEVGEEAEKVEKILYHWGSYSGLRSEEIRDAVSHWKTGKSHNNGNGEPYGAYGTGTYAVSDPKMFSNMISEDDRKRMFLKIDASKLKLYETKTSEHAQELLEYLETLQQYCISFASGYDWEGTFNVSEWNEEKLYELYKSVFQEVSLDFKQFKSFLEEMYKVVEDQGFNKQGNILKPLNKTTTGKDNISTRFMKLLGYNGIDNTGTNKDNFVQGSVIFELPEEAIIKRSENLLELLNKSDKELISSESIQEANAELEKQEKLVEEIKQEQIKTDKNNISSDADKITEQARAEIQTENDIKEIPQQVEKANESLDEFQQKIKGIKDLSEEFDLFSPQDMDLETLEKFQNTLFALNEFDLKRLGFDNVEPILRDLQELSERFLDLQYQFENNDFTDEGWVKTDTVNDMFDSTVNVSDVGQNFFAQVSEKTDEVRVSMENLMDIISRYPDNNFVKQETSNLKELNQQTEEAIEERVNLLDVLKEVRQETSNENVDQQKVDEEKSLVKEEKNLQEQTEKTTKAINEQNEAVQKSDMTYSKAKVRIAELKEEQDKLYEQNLLLQDYYKIYVNKQDKYRGLSDEELNAKLEEKRTEGTDYKTSSADDLYKKWASILALIDEVKNRTGETINLQDFSKSGVMNEVKNFSDKLREYILNPDKYDEITNKIRIISQECKKLEDSLPELLRTTGTPAEKAEANINNLLKAIPSRGQIGEDIAQRLIRQLSEIEKFTGTPAKIEDYTKSRRVIKAVNEELKELLERQKEIANSPKLTVAEVMEKYYGKQEESAKEEIDAQNKLQSELKETAQVQEQVNDKAQASTNVNSYRNLISAMKELTEVLSAQKQAVQNLDNKENVQDNEKLANVAEQTATNITLESQSALNAADSLDKLTQAKKDNIGQEETLAQKTLEAASALIVEGDAAKDASENLNKLNKSKKEYKDNKTSNKKFDNATTSSKDNKSNINNNNKKAKSVDNITKAFKELTETEKEYQVLENKRKNSGALTDKENARYRELIAIREQDNQILAQQTVYTEKQTEAYNEYLDKVKQVSSYIQGLNDNDDFVLKTQKALDGLFSKDTQKHTDEYYERLQEIQDLLNKMKDTTSKADFLDLKASVGKYLDDISKNGDSFKLVSEMSKAKLSNKMTEWLEKNTKTSSKYRKEIQLLLKQLEEVGNIDEFKNINTRFLDIKTLTAAEGKSGDSFLKKIGRRITDQNTKFLARYFSIQDWIRYIRQMGQTVVELDSAITELRKVSDASDERLAISFDRSAQTAKELGDSITNVINVTADWSRLGYSVDDAEKLAEVTTLFKNVGDNMSADDASSYLISTLQGFQMTADQAESIVDKFNEVANNYAIDTKGIGEALQRSAASFNAANTDLSGAIAVVTAANSVVQNPEQIGTAMKTLSARIRGSKVELEELGETEEDVVNLTSKLRNEVKAMTGFDIMEDEETYKSIDEIIIGIGKHWKELTDIQQAALAEDLAGKRNSNVLIALLQNAELVEDIYKTAEGSAKSARKEQENYEKSIQYSLDRFKAVWQEIQSKIFQSSAVKEIIESAAYGLENLGNVAESITVPLNALMKLLGRLFKVLGDLGEATNGWGLAALLGGGALLHLKGKSDFKFADIFKNAQNILKAFKDGSTRSFTEAGKSAVKYEGTVNGVVKVLNVLKTSAFAAKAAVAGIIVAGVLLAWDAFTTTVKEAEEELDKTKNKISELETEIQSLEDIGYRNSEQQTRLELLRDELDLQKAISEEQQRQVDLEKVKLNLASFFDDDSFASRYEELSRERGKRYEDLSYALSDYEIGKYKEENGIFTGQKNVDKLEVEEKLNDLRETASEIQKAYLETQEILDNPIYSKNDPIYQEAQKWNSLFKQQYDGIKPYLDDASKTLGLYNYDAEIDAVMAKYEDLEDNLVKFYKNNQVDLYKLEQTFNGQTTNISRFLNKDVIDSLTEAGIKAEELYTWIQNIADPDKTWKENTRKTLISEIYGDVDHNHSFDVGKAFDDRLKEMGFDWDNKEHQQIILDIQARYKDGTKLWKDSSTWFEEIKKGLEKDIEIKVATPSLKSLLDTDGSVINDLESELESYKKELKDLRKEQSKTASNLLGNVDTNHRPTIYWDEENLKKYAKSLSSWGYNSDELKGTYSTTMFDSYKLDDGRYITFTPVLPDGSILTRDEVVKYINDILSKSNGDAELMMSLDNSVLNGKKYGIFAGISDTNKKDEAGNRFAKDIYNEFIEATKDSKTAEEMAEILTNIILRSYSLTEDNLYDEDFSEIFDSIYDDIMLTFTGGAKDNALSKKKMFDKRQGNFGLFTDFLNRTDSGITGWSEHLNQADVYQKQYEVLQKIDDLENKIAKNRKNDASDYTKYRDELIGLAQAGKLDEDTLKNYEHLPKLLEAVGHSADLSDDELKELLATINELANKNPVDQLKNYGDSISVLDEAYQNYKSGQRIDATQLETIQQKFGDLKSYVDFSDAVMRGEKNLQEYFDAIVTEAVAMGDEFGNVFDGLTREHQDFWVKEMTEKGIKNALEASEEYLQHEEEIYEEVVRQLEEVNGVISENQPMSSTDLEDATWKEIEALTTEATTLGVTADALANFGLQKYVASETDINTTEDCQALLNLAQQSGATADVIQLLIQLLNTLARANVEGIPEQMRIGLAAEAQRLNNEIQNAISSGEKIDLKLNFGGATKAAGGGGKEAGDAYVEAFEKELQELDDLKEAGLISEREYLERLRDLNKRYFKDKAQYAKEYAKYEKQYLQGMSDLYNNAISGAISVLNFQKNKLEKERDKAVKALEKERDAAIKPVQDQIDALEDEQKALEKERDAMQKANDERERAINLQKAQYELERANAQRTRLIYKNGQMQYVNDYQEVRDAKKNLEDALFDEKMAKMDEQIDNINEQIESLNDQLDEINKHYDDLIKSTEEFYDEQIEQLQDMIDMWEEFQAQMELSEALAALDEFGITMDDILSGNPEAFAKLTQGYAACQAALTGNISEIAQALGVSESEIASWIEQIGSDFQNAFSGDIDTSGIDKISNAITGGGGGGASTGAGTGTGSGSAGGGLVGDIQTLSNGVQDLNTNLGTINSVPMENLASSIERIVDALGEEGFAGLFKMPENFNLADMVQQFTTMNEAIAAITTAITGGGQSQGSQSSSEKQSGSEEGSEEGDTLLSALEQIGEKQEDIQALSDTFAPEEGSLSSNVEIAGKAISDEENEDSLTGKFVKLKEGAEENVNPVVEMFEMLLMQITMCVTAVEQLTNKMITLKDVNINGVGGGGDFSGTAYASGNWSAKSKGANGVALTGELGEELVVDSKTGRWHTVGSNGAEFAKIKPNDIVFNHRQTEQLLKNGKINSRGRAYASGNNNRFTSLTPEELSKYNKLDFTKDLAEKLDFGNQKLMNIDKTVSTISNNKTVNNNPVINVNNPTFTCTGVTGEEVLAQIQREFTGLFTNAYQQSMSR